MPNPATRKCPACGTESTGKFCSNCGAPLGATACAKCGATLSARAKFCPECGEPTPAAKGGRAAAPAGGPAPNQRMAWIVAGVALVALIITVIVVVARRAPSAAPVPGPSADGSAGGGGQPATTDITQMSPAEQASRLFDRVMRAQEAGDTAQVNFFAPMAIQAYGMPGVTIDADARLHLGLLRIATGDPAGAVAEADTILKASRTHLYGLLLKARAAEAQGNSGAERAALQAFAANYDAERAKNLPEYAEHAQLLQETRDLATRGAAKK